MDSPDSITPTTLASASPKDSSATLSQHLPHWEQLLAHHRAWNNRLDELFQQDPHRAQHYTLEVGPLMLDFSKNHLNETTLKHLLALAEDCQLRQAIENLISGQPVNNTEVRPAWHTALRSARTDLSVSGEILAAQAHMASFVEKLHSGQWLGHTGKVITDVVNIGIGGSDLGPRMVCKALSDFHLPQINVHFVANIDGAEIFHTLKPLNPETTLFIVASKSFTTLETLENAKSARQWMIQHGCCMDDLQKHFVAISTNAEKATAFGIHADNIFPMWDWVGGRYSLWSAIGLPIAVAVGWRAFTELLHGAAEMDDHFAEADFRHNMPVILAFITFWYSQCWGARSQAILPYCHQLQRFPDFLQQLDMESLGKSVNRQGIDVSYPTGIALWGTEESNGQHSFHQLFHQGTPLIPMDFIATLQPNHPYTGQHRQLLACCLSQSQALLAGKSREQALQELLGEGKDKAQADALASHKVIAGNRPSNTLLLQQLTPRALGSLIALYEHKVYTLSVLLNINAFDQWGVELGKQLGTRIANALQQGDIPADWDSSTRQLAQTILAN